MVENNFLMDGDVNHRRKDEVENRDENGRALSKTKQTIFPVIAWNGRRENRKRRMKGKKWRIVKSAGRMIYV